MRLAGKIVFKANGEVKDPVGTFDDTEVEDTPVEDTPVEDVPVEDPTLINDRIKRLQDSGRYEFDPPQNEKTSLGEGVTNYKWRLGGTKDWSKVEAPNLSKYSQDSYYNPNIATPKVDEHGRVGYDLHPDYSRDITHDDAEEGKEYMYRGMSHEEWEDAKQRGYYQSKGDYNIGDAQRGLTYFADNPTTASSYSDGFSPRQYAPHPEKPGVVVAVPRRQDKGVSGTGKEEIGVEEQIPFEETAAVWHGHPYATGNPGKARVSKDRYSGEVYESSNPASASTAWRRVHDWNTQKSIRVRLVFKSTEDEPDENPEEPKNDFPHPIEEMPEKAKQYATSDRYEITHHEPDPDKEGSHRYHTSVAGTNDWPKTEGDYRGDVQYNPDVVKPRKVQDTYDPSQHKYEYDFHEGWGPRATHDDADPDKEYMYRGFDAEAWEDAQKTGHISSTGQNNTSTDSENQQGMTYYADSIDGAHQFAEGFYPGWKKPSANHPGVIVAVPRRKTEGPSYDAEGEIGTTEKIPLHEVEGVWHGHPYVASPGHFGVGPGDSMTKYKDSATTKEPYSRLAWKRVDSKTQKSLRGRLVFKSDEDKFSDVYRYEHEESGQGPYTHEGWEGHEDLVNDSDTLPTIHSAMGRDPLSEVNPDYYSGTTSPEYLDTWFGKHKDNLTNAGFSVNKYSVPKRWVTEPDQYGQVAFRKRGSKKF